MTNAFKQSLELYRTKTINYLKKIKNLSPDKYDIIEDIIFEYSKDQFDIPIINEAFINVYICEVRTVLMNIDINSQTNSKENKKKVIAFINTNNINKKDLYNLIFSKYRPIEILNTIQEQNDRENVIFDEKNNIGNTNYKCAKCKNNNTISNVAQLASIDEGMTQLIRCLSCGHSWRIR